jgi:multidrug resistance efflux pump
MEEKKIKWNKKRLLPIFSGIVAVIVAGGSLWWIHASSIVSTDDARVKGTIVSVSSKVPGQVEEVLVNDGDTVQAGQVIVRMDSSALEIQVQQAKANLAAAQAKLTETASGNRPQQIAQSESGVAQAAANLDNAQKNYERVAALYEQGAASAQQRDAAKTALDVAAAQYNGATQNYSLTAEGPRTEDIAVAQAQVDQAAAALKNAQLQLDNAVVKAPVAGVVANKSVDAGEVVAVGQPLFSITNLNDVWVAANIEETHVGKVQPGQKVDISVDAYGGRTFQGEVSEVGSATGSQFSLLPTENTSGNYTKVTQRLPVKIKVNNTGEALLKPGMSAVVDIHVK